MISRTRVDAPNVFNLIIPVSTEKTEAEDPRRIGREEERCDPALGGRLYCWGLGQGLGQTFFADRGEASMTKFGQRVRGVSGVSHRRCRGHVRALASTYPGHFILALFNT